MKPFDIELAKKNHPVQTRDGRPVRIICYDRKNKEYPIVALMSEDEVPWFYRNDGTSSGSNNYDLVMVPIKKEGWINIYKTQEVGYIYDTEAEALENANVGLVATIKIEWEE